MYGFIVEKSLRAKNVDSLNRTAISTTADFDGGNLVVLTVGEHPQKHLIQLQNQPQTQLLVVGWLTIPAEALSIVSGKTFAGLISRPKRITPMVQGRPFSVFKPMKYDIIGFTKDCLMQL